MNAADFPSLLAVVGSITGLSTADIEAIEVRSVDDVALAAHCRDGQHNIVACFVVDDGEEPVIYIADRIDMRSPIGRAIVAHELAHAAQWAAKLFDTYSCHAESEALAYAVTNEVLGRSNRTRELMVSAETIARLSACPTPETPAA